MKTLGQGTCVLTVSELMSLEMFKCFPVYKYSRNSVVKS